MCQTELTTRWRAATNANFVNASNPVFNRNGGMFGRNNNNGASNGNNSSRVSVVCGAGLLCKKDKKDKRFILTTCEREGQMFTDFAEKSAQKRNICLNIAR